MLNGKKILFATGGTGGHINPALAVAGLIREKYPDCKILFVGTKEKMESKLVPAAGFDFKTIDISGFQRKLSLENIKRNIGTLSKLLRASSQAKKILLEFEPDVAVGFGGYVSGPVLRMAAKLGIKTAIHEQNAYPGVTNKTLAKYVDRVMLTVEAAGDLIDPKNPCVLTGLPIRGEIVSADRDFARAQLGLDERPMILSMGGSLGSEAINKVMTELIAEKCPEHKYHFYHAMGQYGLWVPDKLRELGVDPDKEEDVTVVEYINNMDVCLAAADLVICRAGASSLSEIEALGKPSILIPSPNVAENHQYHNAMALVNNGAAAIIEEKNLTKETLTKEFDKLMENPDELRKIGENARDLAIYDAAEKICGVIKELAEE